MSVSCDADLKASIIRKLKDFDIRGKKQYSETYPKPFKTAAVLLPLKLYNGEVFILLTKRSKLLRSHASESAFPGGMMEDTDKSIISTALREANEEIGLPAQSVEVLAVINRGITLRGIIVYPVVGLIPNDFLPRVNPSEVEFAFFIPLKDFLCEEKIELRHTNFKDLSYIIRQIIYRDGDQEAKIWGFTNTFCTFLAKIIFDQADYLELFVGSTYTGRVDDCMEEYFSLCYKWIIEHYSKTSKL